MTSPIIYHGTPLTPRAALESVMPGRAACVSFYRPDDLEALLAICPQLMFRPRGVQLLDESSTGRARMGRVRSPRVVAGLLSVARTNDLSSRAMGDHARQPRRSIPAQRWTVERLAIRAIKRRAGLAHGWTDRKVGKAMRAIRPSMHRIDRRPEEAASRLRCLLLEDGRSSSVDGERMAPAAHASRYSSGVRLSFYQRGQHKPRAERSSLRLAGRSVVPYQWPASEVEGQGRLRRSPGGRSL